MREEQTVLLLPGGDIGWSDVRTALRSHASVRIVGEAGSEDDALAVMRETRPDYIFAATAIAGVTTLPLLAALRQHAPESRILIFAPSLDPAELAPYAEFGTAGYLMWSDLTEEGLHGCLTALFEGDVHISSQAAVDAFMETQRDPSRLCPVQIHLAERERAVLRRLAEGQTQNQIADEDGMSERTVKRVVESLMKKLDAPSQFVLGARAARYGLIA